MNTTEQKPEQKESRTETMLDGSLVNYVLISPTGVRIWRKGGGYIDVKPSDPRSNFTVEFNTKD